MKRNENSINSIYLIRADNLFIAHKITRGTSSCAFSISQSQKYKNFFKYFKKDSRGLSKLDFVAREKAL